MTSSHISLLDLSKQLFFQIDDETKKQLCFAETLIISCGHRDGEVEDEASDSEWTCEESSDSEDLAEVKPTVLNKDQTVDVEEAIEQKEPDGMENNFHFFFFPDCSKPLPPKDSITSIVIEDGMPTVNLAALNKEKCLCALDKEGKCPCHTKVPCRCGPKTRAECKCLEVENLCLCDDGKPQLVCTCKPSNVCMCHPDCKPRPLCKCSQVNKPCICKRGKYPCPICICECKPVCSDHAEIQKTKYGEETTLQEEEEEEEVEKIVTEEPKHESEKVPCTCQNEDKKPICFCKKGKECICEEGVCICGVQRSCICEKIEEEEPPCKDDESKSICSCPVTPLCTCFADSPDKCKCFPKPGLCTCGDPEDCKCFKTCDCKEPCICDVIPLQGEGICTCPDNHTKIAGGTVCTCPRKKSIQRKLKRTRAGKHGYRWCHDVDPRHTYFDYGYGRHDKISYEEPKKEKIKSFRTPRGKRNRGSCVPCS
ncbi:unnamed protein product [Leptosia nina]|uniref:Uncharacterized protein n=1 Tax=Leptosia nina TaxID=320188 RepID=A0AAV1IUK4_9NEOP